MRFTRQIDIDAPPAAVWAVWSDVARWPEWTTSMSRVEPLTPGALALGQRVRVRQPKLPTAVWRVTDVDAGRGFTWTSSSPGAHVVGTHHIEPLGNGARATMSIEFNGPLAQLFARLTRSLTHRYLDLEANGLKARSEQRRRAALAGAAT